MTVPRTGDPKARRAILGLWLGAALLSAAMVIACGRKGPPVAPRQIPPPAVADLAGHLQEDHLVLTNIPALGVVSQKLVELMC